MQSTDIPKLPSIQSMLEGVSLSDATTSTQQKQILRSIGHRRHASEQSSAFTLVDVSTLAANSMSGKLEKLSIQPIPVEPKLHDIVSRNASNSPPLHDHIPTAASASTSSNFFYPFPPTRIINHHLLLQNHHHHHRSPRNLHSRSFSDYTHPYSPSSPPRSSGGAHLAPLQPTFHRRAVSTNTLDLILQPLMQRPLDQYNNPPPLYASSSASTVTTNAPYSPTNTNEEGGYTSDESNTATTTRSVSPTASFSSSSFNATLLLPTTQQQQQPTTINNASITTTTTIATTIATATATSTTSTTTTTTAAGGSNKYNCPYCNKGFSRPSSLRIHTYSHTGERPFECPEHGCCRKFSVQSNMRRHLRVHRLGRPLKRNGGLISPADRAQLINKPLAAKPTTTTNWIGVTVSSSSS